MAEFSSFVQISTKKSKSKKSEERGCEYCTLDKIEGINKILPRIKCKDIAVIGQSPGPNENDEGKELVGPSGDWLWTELRRVGIERSDCDVFNSVACFPADLIESSYDSYLKMRNPSAHEIHCCSIHLEGALSKLKAKQILILGQIAAKAVLGTRSLPDQKIFWDDRLKAKVYLLDHPAFFIRGYGSPDRLKAFRETLDVIAKERGSSIRNISDEFHYLRQQDYKLVTTKKEALEAAKIIKASKHRVSVDIEDADFDDTHTIFACGFCVKPGLSFVFVLMHRDLNDGVFNRDVFDVAKELLEDPSIHKVMHYGCSDCIKLEELMGVKVQGFDHDTMLSEYLRFSDQKKYGLDSIVERRLPKFSGYKAIGAADMMPADAPDRIRGLSKAAQIKYIEDKKLIDYSKLSLETLRLYNGADCDVTKRLEISNKNEVNQPLLEVYIDLSFILYRMEPNGPLFDYEQNDALAQIIPARANKLLAETRELIHRKDFNPGSHAQVFDAVYKQLGLEYPLHKGKPNTAKKTMLMLSREHKFPGVVVKWRAADKAESTYVTGYRKCADLNNGRLRTTWWIAGTRTGRFRSGGGGKKDSSRINLQNVHNDPQIKNQCISDKRWRKVYKAISKLVECYPAERTAQQTKELQERIEKLILAKMPDLIVFLALDYGQVEVRVFAEMSGDKNLINDCKESDIHTKVGATITGWDPEKIAHDKKTRTLTKNCIAKGQLVLTDRGRVPIELVTRDMRVWDGLEFVEHDGVVSQGYRDVMTYDELTATPDHEVWTDDGKKVTLEEAYTTGVRLAITGSEDLPVERTLETGVEDKRTRTLQNMEVFDILNAGPRHRFTASGRLVSNCHFGLLFLIKKPNLYDFVVAMSDPEDQATISREMVEDGYDRYFERYYGAKKFQDDMVAFALEHKYVETVFGMKQSIEIRDYEDDSDYEDSYEDAGSGDGKSWRAKAVNGPVQGSAHQLLGCGLVNLKRQPKKYGILGTPVLDVHDNLTFGVPIKDLLEDAKKSKYLMEHESLATARANFPGFKWSVPIVTEGEAGLSLGSMVGIDEKTTVGSFLLDWYFKRKKQMDALEEELLKINASTDN